MAKKLTSDLTLFAVTAALLGLGLVMVWSASSVLAQERAESAIRGSETAVGVPPEWMTVARVLLNLDEFVTRDCFACECLELLFCPFLIRSKHPNG